MWNSDAAVNSGDAAKLQCSVVMKQFVRMWSASVTVSDVTVSEAA